MRKKHREKSKIISIKKAPKRYNIGVVIFSVLLIYLIVVILSYAAKNHVNYYKVQTASFASSERTKGMIFRNEVVIEAPKSGYAVPLVPDGSCVSKGQPVYKIQENPKTHYKTDSIRKQKTLSDKEMGRVLDAVTSFQHCYRPEEFEKTYILANDINALEDGTEQVNLSTLSSENIIKAPADGIFISDTDGYEQENPTKISSDSLIDSSQEKSIDKEQENTDLIGKIQKNIDCKMVIPLNPGLEKKLTKREGQPIEVKFLDDGTSEWAEFHVLSNSNRAIFYFTNPLVRFASKRYVETELIFDNSEGIKVPESSLVRVSRYKIPAKALKFDEWPHKLQFKDGSQMPVITWPVPEKNSEKTPQEYYIATTLIEADTEIKTGRPEKAGKIDAVYVINQGYARVTPVEVLSVTGNKRIVRPVISGSLLSQDLIAGNASKVKENEIVVD